MRKMPWIVGGVAVTAFTLLALFAYHWMQYAYKEKEGKVISCSFASHGAFTAPELELCKLISDPYEASIDSYKIREYETRLVSSPMVKWASVKKRRSNITFHYELREPLFELIDYKNIAIDQEGVLFPLYPFYHAANRVKLLLGCKEGQALLGVATSSLRFALAKQLYTLLQQTLPANVSVKLIDVSLSDAMSLGQRKVITHLQWEGRQVYVLFSPKQMGEVANKLEAVMQLESSHRPCLSVDLRVENRAYLTAFIDEEAS